MPRVFSTTIESAVAKGNLERVKDLLLQQDGSPTRKKKINKIKEILDYATKYRQRHIFDYFSPVLHQLTSAYPKKDEDEEVWRHWCQCNRSLNQTMLVPCIPEVHQLFCKRCESCGNLKPNIQNVFPRPSWYGKSQEQWDKLVARVEGGLPLNDGKVWSYEEIQAAIHEEAAVEAQEAEEKLLKELALEDKRRAQKAMKKAMKKQKRREPCGGSAAAQQEQNQEEDVCSVCLDEFDHMGEIETLVCGHQFHAPCLHAWVAKCVLRELVRTCPYCRASV